MREDYTVISPYLAFKAWGGGPEVTTLLTCEDCGFRFYRRRLSEQETRRYYAGYGNKAYLEERNRFEPFYTAAYYNADSAFLRSAPRRADLAERLASAGLDHPFDSVLDYGGGEGWLIRDLKAEKKIVFDLPETDLPIGIEFVSTRAKVPGDHDLVICAQVLEHVSDPAAVVADIASLLRPGGTAYLEVPNQLWRQARTLRPGSGLLSWLCGHPKLLLLGDIYGTFFRVKYRVLPPLGFVPMREHISFFTQAALRALAERSGLFVHSEGAFLRDYFALARKP